MVGKLQKNHCRLDGLSLTLRKGNIWPTEVILLSNLSAFGLGLLVSDLTFSTWHGNGIMR